jgi:DNA (cytosine-5)-methyltransferase 1
MIIVGFRKDIIGDELFDFALNPPERRPLNIGELLEPTVDAKYTLSDKMWDWIQSHTAKH